MKVDVVQLERILNSLEFQTDEISKILKTLNEEDTTNQVIVRSIDSQESQRGEQTTSQNSHRARCFLSSRIAECGGRWPKPETIALFTETFSIEKDKILKYAAQFKQLYKSLQEAKFNWEGQLYKHISKELRSEKKSLNDELDINPELHPKIKAILYDLSNKFSYKNLFEDSIPKNWQPRIEFRDYMRRKHAIPAKHIYTSMILQPFVSHHIRIKTKLNQLENLYETYQIENKDKIKKVLQEID